MLTKHRGLINLATGLGKTLLALHFIKKYKKKALIICPGESVALQFYEQLVHAFGKNKVGFFGGGKKQIADITVGIAASVCKGVEAFKAADLGLVIVDECFPYRESVVTNQGPKEIGWLVKQWEDGNELPLVKSYNEKLKSFEWKRILYGWRRLNTNLVKVKCGKKSIQCTPNHKFLTTKGWLEAIKLQQGDILLGIYANTAERSVLPSLNADQNDLLIGSFLGDGHIDILRDKTYRLSMTHGIAQKEYAEWKANLISAHSRLIYNNGYASKDAIRVGSRSFNSSIKFPKSKTYCPQEVVDAINAKSLAIWFMDDGSISRKGNAAIIATCSFDEESHDRLVIKLISMGIDCKKRLIKRSDGRAYWHISINAVGTRALKQIILPYVHASMSYKINYQDCSKYEWNAQFEQTGSVAVTSVIPIVRKLKKGRKPYVFDIEVEDNHNFIICGRHQSNAGVIVHNCHHTPASTFTDITTGLAGTGKIFGLTATDYRSDGKDIMITAGCGPVIAKRDIKWGISNGWLAEPFFIVREIKTNAKDFKDDKLKSYKAHVLNCQAMKDQIRSDAEKMMALGKSVLILVDEVAHGKELSEQLKIPFATGLDKNSQDYVDQLNTGKVKGLVGTDGKIGEGSDTKNVDVLILANFAGSRGPVIQCVGRALRKTPTKDKCLILDYIPVDSTMLNRHGYNRVSYYKDITNKVKVIKLSDAE